MTQKLNLTILFISHDLSVVRHICDRTAVMYLGEIVELANNQELFNNPLHPYTQALLSSVPTISDELLKEKIILSGDVPSPRNLPLGCKFHTRCFKFFEGCEKHNPNANILANEHLVKCRLYDGFENT